MLTGAAVSSRLAGAGQGLFCNAAVAEGDVAVCDAEPLCAIVFDAGGCADDADGAGDDAGGSGVETGGAGGSQASAPSAQSSDADHDSACVASDVDDGSGACASDVCARCCAFVRTPAAEALVRLEAAVRATPPGDESARTALQSAADGLSAMLTEDGSPQTSEALRCACGVSYCSASCAKADAIGAATVATSGNLIGAWETEGQFVGDWRGQLCPISTLKLVGVVARHGCMLIYKTALVGCLMAAIGEQYATHVSRTPSSHLKRSMLGQDCHTFAPAAHPLTFTRGQRCKIPRATCRGGDL